MLHIISSTAKKENQGLNNVKRERGENNLAWLARNLPGEATSIVLVGGKSQTSFRLRVAQSHIRNDLLPSYWSHAFLLGKVESDLGSTTVYEISLEPRQGFGFPATENGVQTEKLNRYRSQRDYPNIAVIKVPVALDAVLDALKRFQMQRAVMDAVELILRWLNYCWGVSRAANPLLDNQGIPSSAMLEVVFGAVGYDLTPGLESRSSCPEAIWQAAKWWHEYYEKQNRDCLTGAYHVGHKLD